MSRQAQGRSQASKVYNQEKSSQIDLPRSVACTEERSPSAASLVKGESWVGFSVMEFLTASRELLKVVDSF